MGYLSFVNMFDYDQQQSTRTLHGLFLEKLYQISALCLSVVGLFKLGLSRAFAMTCLASS